MLQSKKGFERIERIMRDWNILPGEIVKSSSFEQFLGQVRLSFVKNSS